MATTKNPAVLWNTTQENGKTGKEKARENIGLSGLDSDAVNNQYVTGISDDENGNLSVTRKRPSTSDLSDFSTEMAKKVDKTTEVNGHALSSDITLNASDISGVVRHDINNQDLNATAKNNAKTNIGLNSLAASSRTANSFVTHIENTNGILTAKYDRPSTSDLSDFSTEMAKKVDKTTEVNGHALSSSITLVASDISGVVRHDINNQNLDATAKNNAKTNIGLNSLAASSRTANSFVTHIENTNGILTAKYDRPSTSDISDFSTEMAKKVDKQSNAAENNFASFDSTGNIQDSQKSASSFKAKTNGTTSQNVNASKTIDTITQDADGNITSVTYQDITTGTTQDPGIVQLSDTISTDTTTAATPNIVKTAKDRADAAYTLAASKQSPATTLDGYGITNAYTKDEVDNQIKNGTLSITVDGSTTTFSANQATDETITIPTHTHSNKSVLDGINSAKVSQWDAADPNVNADWNATSGDAQILNKPTIPTVNNGELSITVGDNGTAQTFTADQAGNTSVSIPTGSGSSEGVLKLSASTTSTSGESGGYAATPSAVKAAYDLADSKADKTEMLVTPGTGADADKTTIQLKSGTWATVLTAHQTIPVKDVKIKTTGGGKISIVDDSGIAIIDSATANGQVGVSRLYGSISVGDSNNGGGATPKAVSDFVEDYASVLVQYKADDAASNYTEIAEVLGRGLSPVLYVPAIRAGESSSYLHLSVSQDCYFHFTDPEDKKIYVLTMNDTVSPTTYSWAQYDLYAKSTEVPFLASSYDTVLYMVTNYGPKSVIPILHTGDRYVCNFKHRSYAYNQSIYHEFMWSDTEIISYHQHTGEIHHEYEIYTNPNVSGPRTGDYKSGFIPVVLSGSTGNYTCNYTYSELLAFYQDSIRFVFYKDGVSLYSGTTSGTGNICTTTFSYTENEAGIKRFDFIFPYVYSGAGGASGKTLGWRVDSNNEWTDLVV